MKKIKNLFKCLRRPIKDKWKRQKKLYNKNFVYKVIKNCGWNRVNICWKQSQLTLIVLQSCDSYSIHKFKICTLSIIHSVIKLWQQLSQLTKIFLNWCDSYSIHLWKASIKKCFNKKNQQRADPPLPLPLKIIWIFDSLFP